MEAIIQDDNGTLYGYYHYEPQGLCGAQQKTAPQIGAARSMDNGASWEDLGIILRVPSPALYCESPNGYFAGGVGDFSVVLDHEKIDAYFFFGNYSGETQVQGVAVGRMPWAQRDTPQNNLAVWNGFEWQYPPGNFLPVRRPVAIKPIYPAALSWHDWSERVDAFWGPSVHWNTYLNQYVMLLNRASDAGWTQEGVYIAFSPVLHDPKRWTSPQKILDIESFYPQVLGLRIDQGTDKLAGSQARLFVGGRSDHILVFQKPD
jgi:hypothetical protein